MQSLLELAPLVAFFVAFKFADIYVATAVLMAAMALLLAVDYLRTRRIPPMHGLSALLVFIFGAATLALHDDRFIKLKPTLFYWLLSLAFIASLWIGRQPLAQRFFGTAVGEAAHVSAAQWRVMNWLWAAAFAALGAINLFAASQLDTSAWIGFKIGAIIATAILCVLQVFWILRRAPSSSGT
jgi:intracellular septation protein